MIVLALIITGICWFVKRKDNNQVNIVDLTHKIHNGMISFDAPWHISTKIRDQGAIEEVGRNTKSIEFGSHAGTHIDAALHFVKGGQSIDQLPLEKLIGPVTIVDFSHLSYDGCVGLSDVKNLRVSRRMIFRFGWAQYWNTPRFYRDWPYFSQEAAHYLVDSGLQVLGLDTPSPDNSKTPLLSEEDSVIHKIFLSSGVTLIEYLGNLERVDMTKQWILCAMPLPIQNGDGSPCRVCLIDWNEEGNSHGN